MKRTVFVLLTGLLLCLSVPMAGAEDWTVPEGFFEAVEQLPAEVTDRLPEGLLSEDPEVVGEAVVGMADAEYLTEAVLEVLGLELSGALRLFALLCGILMLSSVFSVVQDSIGTDGLRSAFGFCTTAAIFSAVILVLFSHMEQVGAFFERLCALVGTMIPVLGALWAMGGNVATASAGTGGLALFLALCQNLFAATVLPVVGFCTVMALCNALSPGLGVRGLASAVKKIYTFVLGLMMTILLTSLSAQTTLTAAADSLTAKTAKMVSSTVIPIVGGSVGETLRTLASGVQYLKGVVGIGGIVLLFLLLLPTLLSLILTRLVFLLSTGVAEMLGCDREGRLLSELGGVYGTMIAVVSMSSVMFMLAFHLFVKTVVAVG